MGCCKIDKSKFSLNHSTPDLFHRSEWDSPGKPSLWYVIYRVSLALLMTGGILIHAFSTKDTLGWKWLAYMTNQGISFLTIHYIFYAIIVVQRRIASHKQEDPEPDLPKSYQVSWGLQNCFTTIALWITLVYWTVLHPIVLEYGLIKTTAQAVLNFFLHGVNTLSCVVDMFVTARPIRIHHFWLPVLFGLWYTFFSVIYWAAGGTGMCIPRCAPLDTNNATDAADAADGMHAADGMDATTETCPVVCDHYVYPILDWGGNPGLAVATIAGGCLVIPVLQCAWYGVYRLRKIIFHKTKGNVEPHEVHPQKTSFL